MRAPFKHDRLGLMQGFIAAFGTSPWGPMALAFLVGVAFGWAIWGARGESDKGGGDENAAEPREIIVIKAELQAARALLDERDTEEETMSEQLSSLDETVKRANGRLKLILGAIKRAAKKE
ncbi:MAG: hypothetical protein KDE05_08205 [Parvularculaceae bacterium]|nr:hypothetical protein [Parvularculaceae bacterium]